ncbi:MAG: hypothetical protein R3B96_11830 [Pirellulaceae bacterium]
MWAGLKEAQSGVGPTTIFDASRFHAASSGRDSNWNLDDHVPNPEQWAPLRSPHAVRGRSRFAGGPSIGRAGLDSRSDSIRHLPRQR